MLELLENYPEAANVIKAYYLELMLEGLNDENLPEDFKQHVRSQGIDNAKIASILDASPRNLFDVFDSNSLFVEIMYMEKAFHFTVNDGDNVIATNDITFETRTECDKAAVKSMIKLLNEKLCQTQS